LNVSAQIREDGGNALVVAFGGFHSLQHPPEHKVRENFVRVDGFAQSGRNGSQYLFYLVCGGLSQKPEALSADIVMAPGKPLLVDLDNR
jgi:hypothetical protein